MKKVKIALRRRKKVKETVKKAIKDLGGLSFVVNTGSTVLISPNYCVPIKWNTGATTNPWESPPQHYV